MKDKISKNRLTVLLVFILISVILTSYSFYKQIPGIDIKQAIRSRLEKISKEILPKVDKGQTKILVPISPDNLAKLAILSENPDFEKYLEYKQFNPGRDDDNDVHDPNIFVEVNDFRWSVVGNLYYLEPKDALRK
jgi:hypothetical protein